MPKSKEHLANVKTQLAEKYDHLASLTKSSTKRQKLRNRAQSYRRQASNALRR